MLLLSFSKNKQRQPVILLVQMQALPGKRKSSLSQDGSEYKEIKATIPNSRAIYTFDFYRSFGPQSTIPYSFHPSRQERKAYLFFHYAIPPSLAT